MWVIYCEDTGVEYDRVEDYSVACDRVEQATNDDLWGYSYAKRWEA